MYNDNYLRHYGVLGMKWGHHKKITDPNGSFQKTIYGMGAKLNPREMKYRIRKFTNKQSDDVTYIADVTDKLVKGEGVLPKNKNALKSIESNGIARHANTKYNNLDDTDIQRLKTYTDSARYSRSVNGYLAIGDPKEFEKQANELKSTLQKNKIDNLTVYRSCNLQFSIDGIAKKLDTFSEEDLKKSFDTMSKNFNGKTRNENRVWSTSTSPLFAIDTWREVNPTAAKTYNTYMIINCKNTPGVLADATTTNGKALVNTRSNQEAILAPNNIKYKKLSFDEERQMFAITIDAE